MSAQHRMSAPRPFLSARRALMPWVLLVALYAAAPHAAPAMQPGEFFTTFLGETIDGQKIELAAMREERVIIIDFWATWAPPSLRQHERLRDVLGGGANDFAWISVSLDRDTDAARAYIDKLGDSAAIYACDGEGFNSPWAQRFSVVMAPALYIIGKEGAIRTASNDVLRSTSEAESLLNQSLDAIDEAAIIDIAVSGGLDPAAGRPLVAKVNEPLPDFAMKVLERPDPVTPGTYEGKVLLIVVFATWESNGVQFLDRVHRELYSKHQPRGFEMLTIAVDKDPDEVVKWYNAKNYRPRIAVANERTDDPWSVTSSEGAFPMGESLPRCFLVGKNGFVRDIGQLSIERIKQVLVEDLNVPL